MQDQKGFIRFRWLLLLGLLAGGIAVYAKENPGFLVKTSPSSLEEDSGTLTKLKNSAAGGLTEDFKNFFRRENIGNEEAKKLGEPQLVNKKQEELDKAQANFFEATVSKIGQGKDDVSDKVTAVVGCIEEAGEKNEPR